ncbi:Uma2 family endonuclease [Deinococcus antarcticus]|uniref:Uma2 family endonuclease n=1 Tax=Deinococcus antarcticus TaxID=1298767 RepID=A0ABV8AAA7_9DEIO
MSVEEYLRTEEKSPYKREYVGSFVYPLHAQAGASEAYTLIGTNIIGTLYRDVMAKGCRIYQNDMKLVVEGGTSFFYPDVMFVCEPDDGSSYAESRPCLLVEIISNSTASHDRFGKYGIYTAIPSLQTYLIVEQKERRVYAYTRQADKWHLDDLTGEGEIHLPCLDRSLMLEEIYAGVL